MSIIEWAEYYLSKGYPIIPLDKNLRPVRAMDTTFDRHELLDLIKANNNIGIPTGQTTNIVGIEIYSEAQHLLENVPAFIGLDTPVSQILSQGKQCGLIFLFLYRHGVESMFAKNNVINGLAIRADNQYVVLPPSAMYNKRHVWYYSQLGQTPLATLPDYFIFNNRNDLFSTNGRKV